MAVRIVTDSTCDLPRELVEQHGIIVVPLTIHFGDETLRDGVDITPAEFYERLAASSDLPRTSQPTADAFESAYRSLAGKADGVVSIHISSQLSGTVNGAHAAAARFGGEVPIEVIDSGCVALGLGAIVLEAAKVAERGGTLGEVADAARSASRRVHVLALVDSLEYLRRGGRIGRASSMLGTLLHIKPILQIQDGEVAPFAKVRTTARAVEKLIEYATSLPAVSRMFVAGAAQPERTAALVGRLRPLLPDTEFIEGDFGPVVGVHLGPNALGLCPVQPD